MGATRPVVLDDDTPYVLTVSGELCDRVWRRSRRGVIHPQLRTTLWKTVDHRWMDGGLPSTDRIRPPVAEVVHGLCPGDVHSPRALANRDNDTCPHNSQPLLLLRESFLHRENSSKTSKRGLWGQRHRSSGWHNRGPDDELRADVLTWVRTPVVRTAGRHPRRDGHRSVRPASSPWPGVGASPGPAMPSTHSAVEGVAHEDPGRA